jgi:hypothetical protein
MEILSEHDGLVTNGEVLAHIQARQEARVGSTEKDAGGAGVDDKSGEVGGRKKKCGDRDWMEERLGSFLASVPCVPAESAAQLIASIDADETLAQLEEGERLQILNLRIKGAVEVHLVVEDCSERLTDDDTDRLLGLVAACPEK